MLGIEHRGPVHTSSIADGYKPEGIEPNINAACVVGQQLRDSTVWEADMLGQQRIQAAELVTGLGG